MRVTDHAVFRRFWYPVMPLDRLADGPKPCPRVGTDIVLWLDRDGEPAAAVDRCCHRTAQLSRGFVEAGNLVCGYHGWTYDRAGRVVRIPQAKDPTRQINFKIDAYRCIERYGYAWVALEEPLTDIPEIPEATDPTFRRIPQFYEVWNCSGLRLMENSFDASHQPFVHRNTFGDITKPQPFDWNIEEQPWGFRAVSESEVVNRDGVSKKALGIAEDRTKRIRNNAWFMPFGRRLGIIYPNGLHHVLITWATPIDDARSMVVQFVFRNDTEADVPAADVIAFDRKVTLEDIHVLEGTDPDVPLDERGEFNMRSDRPGLIMRRPLRELLHAHGEVEVRGGGTNPMPASAAE